MCWLSLDLLHRDMAACARLEARQGQLFRKKKGGGLPTMDRRKRELGNRAGFPNFLFRLSLDQTVWPSHRHLIRTLRQLSNAR